MPRRYLLITPCRDEAKYLQTTIESVAGQTVLPARWVIVDDGSTDATPQILEAAAREQAFIEVVRRDDRGERELGAGVIEAFGTGLERVDLDQFDYLCKLDGDLELPPGYFERLMEHCEADPCLGTVSGKLFLRIGDKLVEERCGDENSVGPSKFYRVDCFRDIGGFVREVCWDGIDGHRCRMHDWIARSIDEPALRMIHLRRMGSSQGGLWRGRLRWGRGKYFMGSRFHYVLAASVYRMLERPYLVGGLGILLGYLQAWLRRPPRYSDPDYLKFLHRYEFRSLVHGKRRTMKRYHDRIRAARAEQSRRRPAASASTPPSPTDSPPFTAVESSDATPG